MMYVNEPGEFFEGEYAMLEKMSSFFQNRLDGYDEHMLTEIDGAAEFYQFTASQLPAERCRS